MSTECIRRTRRAGLGMVLLLASAACATRQATAGPFAAGGRDGEPVLLTVDNQDYRDATIYANWTGVRQRLGMVVGKTTETFRMTWQDYDMHLEVDFIGGGAMTTEPIAVSAGEHVDFVIMPGW